MTDCFKEFCKYIFWARVEKFSFKWIISLAQQHVQKKKEKKKKKKKRKKLTARKYLLVCALP